MTYEEREKQIQIQRKTNLIDKNKKAIDDHEFVISKRKLIDKHSKEISRLLEECQHEKTYTEEIYFSGSYYDQADTTYYKKCCLCGKLLSTEVKTHQWYG